MKEIKKRVHATISQEHKKQLEVIQSQNRLSSISVTIEYLIDKYSKGQTQNEINNILKNSREIKNGVNTLLEIANNIKINSYTPTRIQESKIMSLAKEEVKRENIKLREIKLNNLSKKSK